MKPNTMPHTLLPSVDLALPVPGAVLHHVLQPLRPRQPVVQMPGWHVLGRVLYGVADARVQRQDQADVHVPLPAADGQLWQESWLSPTPVQTLQHGQVLARCNQQVLWGCFSLPLQANMACTEAVQQRYLELFELLQQSGFTHLWRVWNFVSHINAPDVNGLETYRAFNQGRAAAFARFFDQGDQAMPWATRQMPAATAVGCQGEGIYVYFLAGRQPARHIENPRQQPAYHYPKAYGPRPPSFARASAVTLPQQRMLFISGTASIIGHSTVHVGDWAGQCHTTVDNLQIVAARAGRTMQAMNHLKAYVRHARDVPSVLALLHKLLGVPPERISCFVADICRQNLLVEVEAMQL